MARIISLQSISIKNFRSIKEATVTFPQTPGLRFLVGRNLEEPKLGANGAGKSTLWDALYWCLFGVAAKGTRTANLTTWGEDSTEVTLTLELDKEPLIITRAGPPSRLYINAQAVAEQASLETLLGTSKLRFQHSVIFSQGLRLFPDLSIPERGELLEEVLNLNYWSRASEVTIIELKTLAQSIQGINSRINYTSGAVAALPSIEELNLKQVGWARTHDAEVYTILQDLANWQIRLLEEIDNTQKKSTTFASEKTSAIARISLEERYWRDKEKASGASLLEKIEKLEVDIKAIPFPRVPASFSLKDKAIDERKAYSTLSQATSSITLTNQQLSVIEKEEVFWLDTTTCNTCGQDITATHRKVRLDALFQRKSELLAALEKQNQAVELATGMLELASTAYSTAQQADKEETILAATHLSLQREIDSLVAEADRKLASLDNSPYTTQLQSWQERLNPYEAQVSSLKQQVNPHQKTLDNKLTEVNPWDFEIQEINQKRSKSEQELAELKQTLLEFESKATQVEYWKIAFKRLRVFLMHRVLAALEVEVNSAISALGLEGWKASLLSETETKSGSVKLGIQIEITSPKQKAVWDCWSGGESQRLRQALALGVASLIQRASGSWWGLEIWDEPSSFLSTEGVENLLESLDYRAEATKKAIWIVDHTALTYSNFSAIWTAVREKDTGTRFEVN